MSAFEAKLRTRSFGRPTEWVRSCTSTSDRVVARAREGAPEGLCVIADEQTRGRGRAGRVWASPSGRGLLLSLLVRPRLDVGALPPLALAVGVAAAEALRSLGVAVDLKWPNDLLAQGRKLGGILVESASEGPRLAFAVVGIGINVDTGPEELPPELRESATSILLSTGRSIDRAMLAQTLLERLERWYERFVAEGPAEVVRAFRAAAQGTLGRRVRVRAADSWISGTAEDIADGGALILRDEDGVRRRIVAGEVEAELGSVNGSPPGAVEEA
jgi:BirA family biotin operon repressor/biotin-[acetyl-CoA-carboxylase] ligase